MVSRATPDLNTVDAQTVVIGGGIVGLAIARALLLAGDEVVVLEKANAFCTATSARNSEVIHAGIYYPTGSLKAQLCVAGAEKLYRYLAANNIAFNRIGKYIIASTMTQFEALKALHQQGLNNGVEGLALIERPPIDGLPAGVIAQSAIYSANTGIFDSAAYALSLLADIQRLGGIAVLNAECLSTAYDGNDFELSIGGASKYTVNCHRLINAAGLGASDVAATMTGIPLSAVRQQKLCKGSYFQYTGSHLFQHLVYPLPEQDGLGVHATVDILGGLRFGPDVEWLEEEEYGVDESRVLAFAQQVSTYWPALEVKKLMPAYSGIRPKAVSPDGSIEQDFCVLGELQHGVHGLVMLYGIESPGLTASLAIADYVVDLLG
ncbi:NAD(P)/FAD-dependent oxidoreductase [Sinobacterium norvegicum]|nr:FAD-dependent oxidoreductase [Sinobacterium norvegicum]